jgi:regulator of RNase E activity RraB/alpha/beta superfamily hydrolase
MSRTLPLALTVLLSLSALPAEARAQDTPKPESPLTLLDARKGFETKIVREAKDPEPLVDPPEQLFLKVEYKTELGPMSAYLGQAPRGGGKHPAIIWITGGFPPGGIGSSAWERLSPENDQSAKQYRYEGLVMMYPALRGSFGNPGQQETLFGEVDDVLAAAAYLRQVPYVDPERIYLGGHSTGGTLALLVAAAGGPFKAAFSFGPTDEIAGYGPGVATFDPEDEKENRLRSPVHFLGGIRSETYVIEGAGGNTRALAALAAADKNDHVHVMGVEGADHFDVLAPVNELIAERIAKLGKDEKVALTEKDVQGRFDEAQAAQREAGDLEVLAAARRAGFDLTQPHTVEHHFYAWERAPLEAAAKAAQAAGFTTDEIGEYEDEDGDTYYALTASKQIVLRDLDAVFGASAACEGIGRKHGVIYDGWAASRE